MNKKVSGFFITAALVFSGCTNNNQTNGAVIGGITGGLVGSAFGKGTGKVVAVAVGAATGAFIGSQIGAKMDETDHKLAEHAVHKATLSPVGEKIVWSNEHTGHSGSAKTIKVGTDKEGHSCRQIEQELTIEGKTEVVVVSLCRMNDGHWVVAP